MPNKTTGIDQSHVDPQVMQNAFEPITVEVTLPGGISKCFRLSIRLLGIAAVLTVASGLWGAGVASWITWDKINDGESNRQKIHAKIVADEVTKSISTKGILAPSEKNLLQQLSDNFERFFSGRSNDSDRGAVDHAISLVNARLEASLAVEAITKSKISGAPTKNFVPRSLPASLPVRIETVSLFSQAGRDLFRVEVSNANQRHIQSGDISIVAKYTLNDGSEVVSGCCTTVTANDRGEAIVEKGAMYRVRRGVKKYLEVLRPDNAESAKIEFKVGVMVANATEPVYSEWLGSQATPNIAENAKLKSRSIVKNNQDSRQTSGQTTALQDESSPLSKVPTLEQASVAVEQDDRLDEVAVESSNQSPASGSSDQALGDAVTEALKSITNMNLPAEDDQTAVETVAAKVSAPALIGPSEDLKTEYIDPTITPNDESFIPESKSLLEYKGKY